MWLKTTQNYSPNFSLPKRSKKKIRFIIIHYTGMKKESSAIKKLCDPTAKVSSHYFIRKNGNILRLVPDLYESWHIVPLINIQLGLKSIILVMNILMKIFQENK